MSTLADNDPGAVAELLLREMETHNWSQREMAKACQLSNTTISKIVRGQSVPDPNTCFKLAQGLSLPAPHILRMAGHEIAQVDNESPSLEELLHAQFDSLPERAIQEMIGALRAIENNYTTPSAEDQLLAQEKLDQLELIRRWVDPMKRQTLTVVQGGNFLFYQTADLDDQGFESNRSELLPIEEDVSRLSTFPMLKFANSFCVQLYPLCEFDGHRCRSHPVHAVLFTPIYAGDRGSGVIVAYPDGKQYIVRDRITEQVWRKIYADLSADGSPPQLAPNRAQASEIADRWIKGNADELWINPDTRTYAAFFDSPDQDTTYYLLTGTLAEMQEPDWRHKSADRIEVVDGALHGRFETSIVHLQGFCLRVHPQVEHITATRHVVPAHRVLMWESDQREYEIHVCVMHSFLETWLHIAITYDEANQVHVKVLEDMAIHAEDVQQRFEEIRQYVWDIGVPFEDSYSPPKAVVP